MSHFTSIQTQIKNIDSLLLALADLGYKNVEVHNTPQALYGYQDDIREQKAQIIIRRQHIGPISNDVGFCLNENGCYDAIVSEYDHEYGFGWNKKSSKLLQAYAYHETVRLAKAKNFEVVEVKEKDGKLTLRLHHRSVQHRSRQPVRR